MVIFLLLTSVQNCIIVNSYLYGEVGISIDKPSCACYFTALNFLQSHVNPTLSFLHQSSRKFSLSSHSNSLFSESAVVLESYLGQMIKVVILIVVVSSQWLPPRPLLPKSLGVFKSRNYVSLYKIKFVKVKSPIVWV